MEQLFELFFKTGLRPLSILPDTSHLERQLTRSDAATLQLLMVHGQLTMSELAELLGAPLSTATSISKRLVRKGYLSREKSESDQRIIVNRLTPAGASVAAEMVELMEEAFSRVQSALTPEEIQQFIGLALKVAKSLQQETEPVDQNRVPDVRSIEIEGE
ncbi:MarR family winged helix-turn-helix transcriptional regulator [Paenibacillus sp. J2TS4]|uniref:MarR family winged helix-turn-helix transcriptional regulator n=1 Tax=Paenibacillus sp. J2TS4 TaxID=2807194 RepID=UPI001B0CB9F9|nr:MarR family transcriptional regulator [Paenibacillus sp. J2TS4]GIP31858.1 MarR family transcriptional regulator [Paenibacillus sp. J2TS4]